MIISFRTRLFVISGLIVTAVLTAVMLVGWTRVLAFEAQRLEQRLCMEAKRIATQPFQSEDRMRLALDVASKLHLASPDQLILQFDSRTEGENFQSRSGRSEPAFDNAQWRTPKVVTAFDVIDSQRERPSPRPDENLQPSSTDRPRRNEPPLPPPPPPIQADQSYAPVGCFFASFNAQGKQWRAARFETAAGRSVVAADLIASRADVHSALKQALEMVVPLALALTALGAWLLSSLTMRPVNRLRDAMKDVTQKALDQRLPWRGEDREFKVLIDAYNTMLSRLQASFQQASRFSADAAHELKTPLTILQGRIEQALGKSQDPSLQNDLTQLLDEVGRLTVITRKLLLLSQADAGWLTIQRTPLDLSATLDEMASDMHMLMTDQTLSCAIDRKLVIQGDAVLLLQLFNNLISNAVRYCSPGRQIKLSARMLATGVEVMFSNPSQTIQPQDRARFFDRFYRGEASHNRRIDGNGLGLSLAREIARAHGGDLVLMDSALDEVVLQLTLPLA
jgi:two-component system, OmpR family, heavy metal sensor histidine kinase CusS